MNKKGFISLDEVIASLPIEQQEEIKARSAQMVKSHIDSLPFKTVRPENMRSMSLSDDGDKLNIQWSLNLEEKSLLVFTSELMPSILLEFLTRLIQHDERFRQAGITTLRDLSLWCAVEVCQEIEDRERWFQVRLYPEADKIEVDLDTLPRRSN